MEKKVRTLGFVNHVEISVIENGDRLVPVKPICEALDIDYSTQLQRLKEDPILSSTMGLSPIVAADGKQREMQCIPLKYVFGWLFRIDSRNVKEEAREALVNYQMQCYDALYNYFTSYMDFVNEKQRLTEQELEKVELAKKNFKNAKDLMYKAENRLKVVRGVDFDLYLNSGNQLNLFGEEE